MQAGSTPGAAPADCDQELVSWRNADHARGPHQGTAGYGGQDDFVVRLTRTIEADVIPRLVAAHRVQPRSGASNDIAAAAIEPAAVESFALQITAVDDAGARHTIDAHRARGVSVESIYCDLLAPAARRLGEWWEDDRCDFATVTVGLGRLQRLMRELSPAFGAEVPHPVNGRRVLLVRAPDEQHSFGLSLVGEFFRRAGWEAVSGDGGAPADPIDAVRREWFDVVGFSAGSEAKMGWIAPCIKSLRRASRNRNICVLVGGPVFSLIPELVAKVGADATTPEARHAPALAESLMATRVKMV